MGNASKAKINVFQNKCKKDGYSKWIFFSKLYVDFSLWGTHPKKNISNYNFCRISVHSFMMIEYVVQTQLIDLFSKPSVL